MLQSKVIQKRGMWLLTETQTADLSFYTVSHQLPHLEPAFRTFVGWADRPWWAFWLKREEQAREQALNYLLHRAHWDVDSYEGHVVREALRHPEWGTGDG